MKNIINRVDAIIQNRMDLTIITNIKKNVLGELEKIIDYIIEGVYSYAI